MEMKGYKRIWRKKGKLGSRITELFISEQKVFSKNMIVVYNEDPSSFADFSDIPFFIDKNGNIHFRWTLSEGRSIIFNNIKYKNRVFTGTKTIEKYDKETRHLYFEGCDKSIRHSHLLEGQVGELLLPTQPIAITHPDVAKHFVHKSDAEQYSRGSDKKILFKCPHCKHEHEVKIDNLTRRGFSCPVCGDGFSQGERFVASLHEIMGIKYVKQKRFNGANYQYDFFLPDYEIIIEANGIQHYIECQFNEWNLKAEQENDRLKKEHAEKYIPSSKYHVLDFRYSKFDWMVEHIRDLIIELRGSDLTNEDYERAWKLSQKSLILTVCELKNKTGWTTTEIAKELRIDKSTAIDYLKRGNKVGLCKYDAKEEKRKGLEKGGKKSSKPVVSFDENGEKLEFYKSAEHAKRELNIAPSNISMACTFHSLGYNEEEWYKNHQSDPREWAGKYPDPDGSRRYWRYATPEEIEKHNLKEIE